jgi:Tfp pilus assembly protein PilV
MINKNFKRGFTLVETLGAVLLLSIAIVGPLTIAQKGLSTALISKDQNTAFNLAQDAVEYLRFARDTNCLVAAAAGSTACPAVQWLNGNGTTGTVNLGACISTDGSAACTVDSYSNAVAACAGGVCSTAINYDATPTGINAYSYSTGTPSIFTRTVQIQYNSACTTTCNPNEADITVTVSWNDPLAHSIVVKESLYDWQ